MTTRLFAVVGDPIAHSLSPAMQNAAIAARGLDATYVPMRTTEQAFAPLVRELLAAGGGLNVTMPFKQLAAQLVRHPTDAVRTTEACNTIWGDPDAPSGDNTDVTAIRDEALRLTGGRAGRIKLVGTGGSARAAVAAFADGFPGVTLDVGSRSLGRARDFALWASGLGLTARVQDPADQTPVDLLLFATPDPTAKLAAEPGQESEFRPPVRTLLDLRYAKGGTLEVRLAWELRHVPAADGRGVLVAQGAAAFERFFGAAAPVEVMRRAVEDALRP